VSPAEAYDAVVVGGGVAGLSAATWLARYRQRVLVLDSGEQRNRWVELAHGYLGFDPIAPGELLDRARRQLDSYPEVEVRRGRAESVERGDDGRFDVDVWTERLRARRIILATGVADRFPEVDGFFDHYGSTVFHCPTCEGYDARDLEVVVFGWSRDVADFALTLGGWASKVTVVTDGRRFQGDESHRRRLAEAGTAVVEDDALKLVGPRGQLSGVRLERGGLVPCQMAFFSIAHEPQNALARQLGCHLTEEGCIEVNDEGATDVAGVYAAGDITPGLQLVQVAAAKGTIAGVACARSLRGEGGAPSDWDGRLA
jgi:thioredoxin reductase